MTQEKMQQQDVGRMQSKPLEASPVVSNTTLAHDRLGGVLHRLTSSDESTLALLNEAYHLLVECDGISVVMTGHAAAAASALEIENHIVLNKEIPHA